jgi:hypothetical protein
MGRRDITRVVELAGGRVNKPSLSDPHRSVIGGNYSAQFVVLPMSALGQKQTFAVQNVISTLPPIADICSAQAYVRFVPIADIGSLFDHFIGANKD